MAFAFFKYKNQVRLITRLLCSIGSSSREAISPFCYFCCFFFLNWEPSDQQHFHVFPLFESGASWACGVSYHGNISEYASLNFKTPGVYPENTECWWKTNAIMEVRGGFFAFISKETQLRSSAAKRWTFNFTFLFVPAEKIFLSRYWKKEMLNLVERPWVMSAVNLLNVFFSVSLLLLERKKKLFIYYKSVHTALRLRRRVRTHSHWRYLVRFNRTQVRFHGLFGSFGVVWMHIRTLVRTKQANRLKTGGLTSLASEHWCGSLAVGACWIFRCLACCSNWAASYEKTIRFEHGSKNKNPKTA